jgi:hypothetical protein
MAGKSKKSGGARLVPARPGAMSWAHATRDVLLASMNNGLFAFVAIWLLMLGILWKLPDGDVTRLTFDVLAKLEKGELWAYILLVLVLATWYFHARAMRRNFTAECERIGREKSALQNDKGHNFSSSELRK